MIDNILVPKHELLSKEEAEEVLKKYNVAREEMPKIKIDDPAIEEIESEAGDIFRITRINPVAGESFYYRVVEA